MVNLFVAPSRIRRTIAGSPVAKDDTSAETTSSPADVTTSSPTEVMTSKVTVSAP